MLYSRRRFLQSGALASTLFSVSLPGLNFRPAVKVAILGAGEAGRRHFQSAHLAGSIELVGICDPVQPMAEALAVRAACVNSKSPRVYDDYEELLAREEPEIVVLASPDHWHFRQCLACLESGADVMIETLPVLTSDQADKLARAIASSR